MIALEKKEDGSSIKIDFAFSKIFLERSSLLNFIYVIIVMYSGNLDINIFLFIFFCKIFCWLFLTISHTISSDFLDRSNQLTGVKDQDKKKHQFI